MPQAADIPFEAIRERAYDLWERHHRPEGFSIELWLMAERELRVELALRAEREGRGVPAGHRPEPAPPREDASSP